MAWKNITKVEHRISVLSVPPEGFFGADGGRHPGILPPSGLEVCKEALMNKVVDVPDFPDEADPAFERLLAEYEENLSVQIREYLPARFQQPDGRDLVVSETSSTSTDASGTDWVRGAGGIALLLARAPRVTVGVPVGETEREIDFGNGLMARFYVGVFWSQ